MCGPDGLEVVTGLTRGNDATTVWIGVSFGGTEEGSVGAGGNEDECRVPGLLDESFSLFYDVTHLFEPYTSCFLSEIDNDDFGPALAVDAHGNMYATFLSGVVAIDSDKELLATIPFDHRRNGDKAEHYTEAAAAATTTSTKDMEYNDDDNDMDTALIPVGITFGNDGYLYVTTR